MQLQTTESAALVEEYLQRMRAELADLSADEREHLISYGRAQIELDTELAPTSPNPDDSVRGTLERLGPAAQYARRLRQTVLPTDRDLASTLEEAAPPALVPCRTCTRPISREACQCPHCGAPFPARRLAPASGYEYKSRATLFGWPLVHVAFGRDRNGRLRVAKGVIAIGQFGIGAITFAQFGVGLVFGLGQFMLAPFAIGQFAGGLAAAGQFGLGILAGAGQFATGLLKTWGLVTWP